MSDKKERKSTAGDDDVCVVCFKDITIRCIMDCEHTICFECSTRLRVLCGKLECPICRQETTIAVFTREKGTFRSMYLRALYNEDQYKLALEDEEVRRAFSLLQAHRCLRCQPRRTFPVFKQLADHMSRQHQLQYCELCVKHLKIFSSERKLYTREKLALHKRKGDPDDSSHRGHPLCEYCQQRYNDKDELFLHLRRDHFHCHLCEADGRHIFYDDYLHLADHFREDHFFCEQGQCKDEKFVVFRTDIDLQAHRASVHSDNKSRGQQRQDRTLTLEFSSEQPGRRRRNDRYDRNTDRREPVLSREPSPPPPQSVNTSSQQEFPTLSAAGATGGADEPDSRGSLAQRVAGATGKTVRSTAHRGKGRPWDNRPVSNTDEEFPSLGGGRAAAPPPPQPAAAASAFSVSVQRRAAKHGSRGVAGRPAVSTATTAAEDFPSLAAPHRPAAVPVPARPAPERAASAPLRAAPAPAPAPSLTVNVQRRPASAKGSSKVSAGAAAGRSADVTIDFKRRPASAGAAAAAAASAAADYDYEEPDDVPRISQVSNTSNITIQRQEEPVVPRSSERTSRPPALTKDSFPSLGKPAAATASSSWVPNKAEPPPKPTPVAALQPPPAAGDFPTLGPVAAYGNFGSFSAPRGGPAASSAWGGAGESAAGKGKKNKKGRKPASASGEHGSDRAGPNGVSAAAAAVNGLSLSGPPADLTATGAARAADGSFQYQQPDNFTARNTRLVSLARHLFNTELEFDAFKTLSKAFREAELSAEEYYSGCMNLLGNDKFGKMFPELLVLLPNIARQQELLAAHQRLNKNGFQRNKFPSCPTCGQVLVFDDLALHTSHHFEDGDFPVLG